VKSLVLLKSWKGISPTEFATAKGNVIQAIANPCDALILGDAKPNLNALSFQLMDEMRDRQIFLSRLINLSL
jgi:hypothetical protein